MSWTKTAFKSFDAYLKNCIPFNAENYIFTKYLIYLQPSFACSETEVKNKTKLYFVHPDLLTTVHLRWPDTIYLHVGYIFKSRVLARKSRPISLIFGILNKECSNFNKMLFFFFVIK